MNTDYQPQHVLITGGAGFIGSNFIRYYLKTANIKTLVNLDLLTYAGSTHNLKDFPSSECHYHFVQGDICDRELVNSLLQDFQIDTVIHFAAESHVDRSISGPAQFIQTNVVGTFTLLEAARQFWLEEKAWNAEHCRFHHVSTDEVYGSLNEYEPSFTEHHRYAPNSPYSASKAGSDHLVRAYFHTYQLPMTMSNCSNNYGPYQHSEKLIPTIIRQCFAGQIIPIYGDGSNIRDWLYVEDHCEAIHTVISKGKLGSTYNIGGKTEISNLALAKEICKIMNKRFPRSKPYENLIEFVKDRPGHDWRYAIDTSKIENEIGWHAKESFVSGIEKTIRFYECAYKRSEVNYIHLPQ